ncbi:hypothetical protein ACFJGW_17615 [Burkholderiaceae bacterium UC74_6]
MPSFIRSSLLFALGVVGCLLACELVLRALPVYIALTGASNTDRAPLLDNEPHTSYRYSAKWFMNNPLAGRTNNYGQTVSYDYAKNSRPMIVVGDSFVESLMNPEPVRIQSVLAQDSGLPVYALGASGLSASDYLMMAREAHAEFKPRAAVFAIIDGDFVDSLSPKARRFHVSFDAQGREQMHFTASPPSASLRKLRDAVGDVALIDYMLYNLGFTAEALKLKLPELSHVPKPAQRKTGTDAAAIQAVVDWFLAELPRALDLPPQCIAFAVDADRYALYDPKLKSKPQDPPEVRRHLVEAARAKGFNVVDLAPVFAAGYARDGLKFDHWPLDRHWNALGHATVAHAVEAGWPDKAACGIEEKK